MKSMNSHLNKSYEKLEQYPIVNCKNASMHKNVANDDLINPTTTSTSNNNRKQKSKRPKSAFGPSFPNSFVIAPNNNSSSYLINSNSSLSLNQNPFYKYITGKNEKYCLNNGHKDNQHFKSTSFLTINPSPNENSNSSHSKSSLNMKKNLKCASSVTNNLSGPQLGPFLDSNRKNESYKSRFFRHSKSINEDSPEYDAIKALRDSVDSLNFKFDESQQQSTTNMSSVSLKSSASNGSNVSSSRLSNSFRINLNELNEEFSKFDSEFSANTWADMQTEAFLNTLNKQSRNKQENIFEFMKTEVNYVKILCITQKIYVQVMLNECKIDPLVLKQLFPDLDKLLYLHRNLLEQLLEHYKLSQHKYIESIGEILSNTFKNKCEEMVQIYSKVCCMHLNAKNVYKHVSNNNKAFGLFLSECRKHQLLKRYQIPDCLTIITQRLTKYLTLIENMINNSKEDRNDLDLLNQSLENLRSILNKVNEAVAFHQNMCEFRRIFDNFEPKSATKFYSKHEKEPKLFTKVDLDVSSRPTRRILSINRVEIKFTNIDYSHHNHSNKHSSSGSNIKNNNVGYKTYKDSALSCTQDILIRPSKIEQTSSLHSNNSSTSMKAHNSSIGKQLASSNSITSNHSFGLSFNNNNYTLTNNSNSNTLNNLSNNSSQTSATTTMSPYIINLRTNQMIEITFPDELGKNQWLNIVHTHICPLIDSNNSNHESSHSNLSLKTPIYQTNLHHQSSTVSNSSLLSQNSIGSSVSASAVVVPASNNKNINNNKVAQSAHTKPSHAREPSAQETAAETSSNKNSDEASDKTKIDMQLSPDLAEILYSFNYLIEQTLANSGANSSAANFLMRSASSAGETITRGTQEAVIAQAQPKRAETFNGSSSNVKETNAQAMCAGLSSLINNINPELLKSRILIDMKKNGASNNNCNVSEAGVSHAETTDSGYHSRLCMDFNHDLDNASEISCMCFNNSEFNQQQDNKMRMSKKHLTKHKETISVSNFETILKFILTDYMRIKNENETLKKELKSMSKHKGKSSDEFKDDENADQKKSENNCSSNGSNNLSSDNSNSHSNIHHSKTNKLSILVNHSASSASTKKEDSKSSHSNNKINTNNINTTIFL